ncbi:MAG: Mov34/MPN/PAD-1 family protein, partial [Nanoarchaeota archaeon]
MLILTEENKLQIKEHALRENPNECCGLFIENMGVLELENKSKTPAESFIIDYNTLKKAEKYGRIKGFYHSHPEDEFSNIDNLISEKRMLSSVIYKIKEDSFSVYNPVGLEIPYVGREFVMGIFDCFTLVQEYYLRERNIKIPDFIHKYRYTEDISLTEI